MKHPITIYTSLVSNVLLIIAVIWMCIANQPNESCVDCEDRKTPFSFALVGDIFTSVGDTEILKNRKLRAARLYILSSLLDDKFNENLYPEEKAIIEGTLYQGSSRDDVRNLFLQQFRDINRISIDFYPDGIQRLYFSRDGDALDNKVQFVILSAKSNIFMASDDPNNVEQQIERFVESMVNSVMTRKFTNELSKLHSEEKLTEQDVAPDR